MHHFISPFYLLRSQIAERSREQGRQGDAERRDERRRQRDREKSCGFEEFLALSFNEYSHEDLLSSRGERRGEKESRCAILTI